MEEHSTRGKVCACPHHKFMPGLVVIFGLVFLLGAYDVFSARFVSVAWPVIVILAGLFRMSESKCTCC